MDLEVAYETGSWMVWAIDMFQGAIHKVPLSRCYVLASAQRYECRRRGANRHPRISASAIGLILAAAQVCWAKELLYCSYTSRTWLVHKGFWAEGRGEELGGPVDMPVRGGGKMR